MANAKPELTSPQNLVLKFLKTYVAEWGYAPTLLEISDKMGYASPNGGQVHLLALEKKGYIERQKGYPRTIRIL